MSSERTRPPRVVGIDLGTTNCAVAWAGTAGASEVEVFPVPQLVAPGEVEAREVLPSFHYDPLEAERNSARLPWQPADPDHVTGWWARQRAGEIEGRTVASAKSWLSHSGVDRTGAILPWHAAEGVRSHSPVEVSARLLGHVRAAWNHTHPDFPLEAQEVVVTIPASFDEVARELTVQAAKAAGLRRVHLLEEPQAAFYAWLHSPEGLGREWPEGARILVCDIGGGTTDFTLIESAGDGNYRRTAVGEHLILGGDNLDLALALHLEARHGRVPPAQWARFLARCREAKELLLGDNPPESCQVTLVGSGRGLVGGTRQLPLTRGEAEAVLLEGFLPRTSLQEGPQVRKSGFQEFGLPYAPDPAMTRYLAEFLRKHAEGSPPQAVLLNGGFFESPAIRARLVEVLGSWFPANPPATILHNARRDLAVALGAAHYGRARLGLGRKIRGGLLRSYYLGFSAGGQHKAVCVAPAVLEEGQRLTLTEPTFELLAGEAVEFPVYVSSVRTTDKPGTVVDTDPESLRALPPVRTVLKTRQGGTGPLPVLLQAELTAVGTLEVGFREKGGHRTWRLAFDVRPALHTDHEGDPGGGEEAGVMDEELVSAGVACLQAAFAPDSPAAAREGLVRSLEDAAGRKRFDWPPTLMRAWATAMESLSDCRRHSASHEARWLNLHGFLLRPGHGVAADDVRVVRAWRVFDQGLRHENDDLCRAEWWIFWRRIAGGLGAGAQRALADSGAALWRRLVKNPRALGAHERDEFIRCTASLESLPCDWKIQKGAQLLAHAGAAGWSRAVVWALGRLGARQPVRGPLNTVVPAETAQEWFGHLRAGANPRDGETHLAAAMLARRTGDRFRDWDEAAREGAAGWLEGLGAGHHLVQLVRLGGDLEAAEVGRVLGDRLPAGLRLPMGGL